MIASCNVYYMDVDRRLIGEFDIDIGLTSKVEDRLLISAVNDNYQFSFLIYTMSLLHLRIVGNLIASVFYIYA
jgi:hypothetical protein